MSFSVPFSFEMKARFSMRATDSFVFMNFFLQSAKKITIFFFNGGANHFFAVTHKPTSRFVSKFRQDKRQNFVFRLFEVVMVPVS